jgi:hypothetical protein
MKNEHLPEAPPNLKPAPAEKSASGSKPVQETGGPSGPEPTRYGDWERGGRCVDF